MGVGTPLFCFEPKKHLARLAILEFFHFLQKSMGWVLFFLSVCVFDSRTNCNAIGNTHMSKKSGHQAIQEEKLPIDTARSPYCHALSDTVEDWDALTRRIEDLKKRADKIHLSYLMTEEDVAAFLSLNPKWLGERRTAGKPPFYYKFGTGQTAPVRYSLPEVMDFLMMCCRRQSTSEELTLNIDLAEALYMDKYGRKTGEQIPRLQQLRKSSSSSQQLISQ